MVGDTPEDKERAKRDAKRFRIVIVPVDRDSRNGGRSGSVYSRTSSISKSIRGEGAGVLHDDVDHTDADETNDENDKLDASSPDLDNITSPMSPKSDYQDAMSNVDPAEQRSPRSPQIKFSEHTEPAS